MEGCRGEESGPRGVKEGCEGYVKKDCQERNIMHRGVSDSKGIGREREGARNRGYKQESEKGWKDREEEKVQRRAQWV